MNVSIFLAKSLGIYLILISLALVFKQKWFSAAGKEVLMQKSVILFSSIFALILGILLVVSHSLFVSDWRIVITILAWITFLKGFIGLFFPDAPWRAKLLDKPHALYIIAIICLFLGLFLAYHGFVIYQVATTS